MKNFVWHASTTTYFPLKTFLRKSKYHLIKHLINYFDIWWKLPDDLRGRYFLFVVCLVFHLFGETFFCQITWIVSLTQVRILKNQECRLNEKGPTRWSSPFWKLFEMFLPKGLPSNFASNLSKLTYLFPMHPCSTHWNH